MVPRAAWRRSRGEQGGEVNESARIVEESKGRRRQRRHALAPTSLCSTWQRDCSTKLELHVVPVPLGDGARLFDNLGDAEVQLEQVRAVEPPGVTHLKYRVVT